MKNIKMDITETVNVCTGLNWLNKENSDILHDCEAEFIDFSSLSSYSMLCNFLR
jgi:hypothetical protein